MSQVLNGTWAPLLPFPIVLIIVAYLTIVIEFLIAKFWFGPSVAKGDIFIAVVLGNFASFIIGMIIMVLIMNA